MRILLVVDNFYPEIGSAAHVYHELARGLIKRGHEVHVITKYPRPFYLSEEDKVKDYPLDEVHEGIRIHRSEFRMAFRDNVVFRGFEHYLVPYLYFKTYKRLRMRFDGIVIYIPPYPLYQLGIKIKRRDGTKSVLNIQDIHPQELVDVGMLKNPAVIKFLEMIERRAYRKADYITVLSPSGENLIVSRGGDKKRIRAIFNSIDLEEFDKGLIRKDYKELEGISERFLVSYAGIINSFQGIDDILDVAKRFIDDRRVVFYIVGDGMETERLKERIEKEKIGNVVMKPLQPKNVYLNIINSSDISIVSLDRRMTAPCVPGKFVNLMGAGKCIIANVPKVNDVHKIAKDRGVGIPVEPGDIDAFEEAIRKLMKSPELRAEMGRNGRRFVEENMNLDRSVRTYEAIFGTLKER